MAAGYVENIARLAQAREAPTQGAHQLLASSDRHRQMRRAGRPVEMVQVIGPDARLDKGAHEGGERHFVVIDALRSTVWLSIGMPASINRAQADARPE